MKIIFSDVDGTLMHRESESIKIPFEDWFVCRDTIRKINAWREAGNEFVLVTGRSTASLKRVSMIPYDYAIIEHGCVILDKNGEVNKEWKKKFEHFCGDFESKTGILWDYERQLINEGLKTFSSGRFASFRVFHDKPNNMSEAQIKELELKVKSEMSHLGLVTIRNIDMLDIIPVIGGKEKAISFILKQDRIALSSAIACGDDVNDCQMLELIPTVACPGNAKNVVKDIVRRKFGYVSALSSHEGTVDMLTCVMKER